jgi:acetyl esterase
MAVLLHRIQRAARPPFHSLSPAQARRAYEAAAEVLDLPRAPLPVVHDFALTGGDGQPRPARRYASSPDPRPILLYLHGGGFVIGSLNTHDSLCRQLALRSDFAVVALDYRLAPEHPFPAAVDDAWAALQALAQEASAKQLPLAVAGDSAGGTLAAVCALLARAYGLPGGVQLALQLLITPGTAARTDSASHRRFGKGYLLEAETMAWMFNHYIEDEQRHDWRFAPLNADPDGVAPCCLLLAECDPLVDEGLAYGDHLRAAGVPVELDLQRGVTHDFIKMGRVLREADAALQVAALALTRAARPAPAAATGSQA